MQGRKTIERDGWARRDGGHRAAWRALALVASGALVLACGATTIAPTADDPACDRALCPNDPTPPSSSANACNQILSGGCGATYRAFLDCAVENAVCDGTGHVDEGATIAACQSQYDTYNACVPGYDAGEFGSG